MSAISLQLSIALSTDTLTALANSGFCLYGFKAVRNSDQAGRPLVWLQICDCAESTIVSWTEQYEAYISGSPIVSQQQIIVGTAAGIMLGETLQVEAGGTVSVLGEGPTTAISIFNSTSQPYTCGISEFQNGSAVPICAFPLNGNGLEVIAPLEKILLMFSTAKVNLGTIVDQALSSIGPGAYCQGILVDLTGSNERSVSFDINEGWSWGAYAWAQQIPCTSSLVPFLIEN